MTYKIAALDIIKRECLNLEANYMILVASFNFPYSTHIALFRGFNELLFVFLNLYSRNCMRKFAIMSLLQK